MPVSVAGSGAITGASTLNGLSVPIDALAPGIVLINQTVFTTASSVSINSCFTSTYENYRILLNHTGSANSWTNLRLRASGVDASGSNYNLQRLSSYSTTTASSTQASSAQLELNYSVTTAPPNVTQLDIFSPAVTQFTGFSGICSNNGNAGTPEMEIRGAYHGVASAYDGLTLFATTGTISGTIRIYGYRNA